MDSRKTYVMFGRQLARWRASAKMSQHDLAESSGMTRASIANIENGRQKVFLHQVVDLAAALKLSSAHELLPRDLLIHRSNLIQPDLQLTGSEVSDEQKSELARIIQSFDDWED